MSRFLYMQCLSSDITYPSWARRWINIRKVFCNAYHVQRAGVSTMLEILGLAFKGHPHSGIDDARNIARILAQLISDGCNVYENEKLVLSSPAATDDTQAAEVVVLEHSEAEAEPVDDDDDIDDVQSASDDAHRVTDSRPQEKSQCPNNSHELLDSQPLSTEQTSDDSLHCAALLEHLVL